MRSLARSIPMLLSALFASACAAGVSSEDPADLESVAAEEAALRFADTGDRAPAPVTTNLGVALQAKPERSECHLICLFGVCFTCCGFPSDDESWSCTVLGGS